MEDHGRGDEDADMLSIKIDKRPISQAQLIGFLAVLSVQIFFAGGLYYKFTTLATDAASKADFKALTDKVEAQDTAREIRSSALDRNIDDMQQQLRPLAVIEQRMDQNDKRDDVQDARIDRLIDLVSSKFDGLGARFDDLSKAVGEVKADVRVVAADVKGLAAKGSPTSYRTP